MTKDKILRNMSASSHQPSRDLASEISTLRAQLAEAAELLKQVREELCGVPFGSERAIDTFLARVGEAK